MEKITKVTKAKQNMYQVWFTSGEHLLVSEDVLVKKRLLKDMELTPAELEDIRKESQIDFGYQRALHYLNFQLRTEMEVATYLKKQEVPSSERRIILTRLKEMNVVDDLFYAESFVRTAIRMGDKGPQVVAQQLSKRGVRPEISAEALTLYTATEEAEICLRVAAKAFKKYQRESHHARIQKVRQHLYTKGFTGETIQLCLSELSTERDEETETDLLQMQLDKLWEKHARLPKEKRRLKIIRSLQQKGFQYDLIKTYLTEKEMTDEGSE